ncbi:MAG: tetratricopeptide repeat protein [Bacteroidota bacterium]|nr:tetratricopeptide repeat protein [Bacteroidota bacterium]
MKPKKYIIVILVLAVTIIYNCSGDQPKDRETTTPNDTLVYLNHADTAKFVGMKTCMLCHQDKYNTFVNTGMGKSFEHAHKQKSAANFQHALIYDKFSDFYYKAFWAGDSMKIMEFRLDKKDTVYKRIETVNYIIGSGQHTNSHMQSVNGYFNQMPMTYYTQLGKWDLPPGFEDGHNTRFTRKIGLECMSCHNSYPDFVEGSENKYNSVPEGITCERCHGPGSIHVAQRQTGEKIDTSKYIDYSIVNPSKLSIDAQFDVCQRCHLQGNAVVKEGKSFYDFKPGMKLSDYISVFLPKYKNADDEFIMASHADRLKQSACFIKSKAKAENDKHILQNLKPYKNAMTCVTCHNPHVSVKETNKNVYNDACNSCHGNNKKTELLCSEKTVRAKIETIKGLQKEGKADASKLAELQSKINCVGCHMPRSGSIDIPHVTVHDHYIRKPISKKEKEKIKEFVGLFSINEKNPDALTKARAYINQYEKFEWKNYYLDSARLLLKDKSIDDVSKNIEALVQLYFLENNYPKIISYANLVGTDVLLKQRLTKKSWGNENAWTCYRIGDAFMNTGQVKSALSFFTKANELAPFNPDFKDKLASCYAQIGDAVSAEKYYKEALSENPKFTNALANYGFLCISTGRIKEAEELYKKGLAIDPDHEMLMMNQAGLYNYKGDLKNAKTLLQKVLKKHPDNKQAQMVLRQLP